MFRIIFVVIMPAIVMLTSCMKQNSVAPPAAVGPVPSEEQMRWHEMEMNAFIHFSINTFTDKEWGFGDESPALFNPSEANTDQWVSNLKEAGFKGIILTCKHHDGFCLWPSAYTKHSIASSPYKNGKGDLVKELSESCQKNGMRFGVYLSPWDRNHPEYGRKEYVTYYRNQLTEIFQSYGPVFEMWFDGANGGDGYYGGANEKRSIKGSEYYDWLATLGMIRKMEPQVIFFSDAGPGVRWVGNEKGIAGETNWNTITPDTLFAGKAGIENLLQTGSENGTHWIPAETDVSIRPGWFYHQKEDTLVKSPEKLFDIYLTSVGRGSTLLLNVPPDRRGLIHENDVQSLKGFRKLLDNAFHKNLAAHAEVSETSFRGNSETYSGKSVTDSDEGTYWATDDHILEGSLDINLGSKQLIRFVEMQEYIRLGQRVNSFTMEIPEGEQWKKVAEGTTVGYKRIVPLQNVQSDKIRITFRSSKACPLISTISVY